MDVIEDQIIRDIEKLEEINDKTHDIRNSIIDKLNNAIASINTNDLSKMKTNRIIAITSLINSLSASLNDIEGSRLNAIKIKQKHNDISDSDSIGKIVTTFIKKLKRDNLEAKESDKTNSLTLSDDIDKELEKVINENGITVSMEETELETDKDILIDLID